MDPITLAALGLSGVGTIFGGISANNANRTNRDIGMLNYYQQRQARADAMREGEQQQSEAKLGVTDAAGNRTYFIPGQGWVTDLTPVQQQIQTGTEDEQLRQLTTGADRAERVDARANDRRNREDVLAQSAEDEYRNVERPNEDALRQLFLARGAEQRNRSADRAGNAVARQNIRAGGRNAAELTQGARAASDASSARQAGVDAQMQASNEADRQFDHGRDRATALYDYFRRASTSGTQSPQGYMPQGPGPRSSGVADQMLINVASRAPEMPYQSPNFAMTDTMHDLGQSLYGFDQARRNKQLDEAILDRMGRNVGKI